VLTAATYEWALEQFLAACLPIEDSIVSVILFGSMARAEIRPGKSDILDVIVVLRQNFFDDRVQFLGIYRVIIQACRDLKALGLPFHPVQIYSEREFYQRFWAPLAPMLLSDRYSKIVLGLDIRSLNGSSDVDGLLARLSFFGCRRLMQRASHLTQVGLEESGSRSLRNAIEWFLKDIFTQACLTCGRSSFHPDSPTVIHHLFPKLDLSALEPLRALGHIENVGLSDATVAVEKALAITEELNRTLVEYLQEAGVWETIASEWSCQTPS